jgi:hypothetical protein
MQMLMFHEAARGSNYTGLTHRYQPQIDLSEHIRLGQAVLVGRAEQPATKLNDAAPLRVHRSYEPFHGVLNIQFAPIAEKTEHWTYFRIIFPVNTQPSAPNPEPRAPSPSLAP